MENKNLQNEFLIKPLNKKSEAEECARITASSEPWKTLGIGYEDSLKFFDEPLHEFYVAITGGKVIGYVAIQIAGAFTGYIRRIAVHSDWRGKGIGSQLMQFSENRIFTEKPNVFLCVSSFNTRAQELYKKLGYEVIGEIKDYVAAGYSEILMRKTKGPILTYKP